MKPYTLYNVGKARLMTFRKNTPTTVGFMLFMVVLVVTTIGWLLNYADRFETKTASNLKTHSIDKRLDRIENKLDTIILKMKIDRK